MVYTWLIFSLLSAITIAGTEICSKKILNSNKVRPIQITFDENFLLTLVIGIFFIKDVIFGNFGLNWFLYLIKIVVLFAFKIIYLGMMKKYEISSVAPLLNLSPVFLIMLTSIFLSEKVTMLQLIGIMITIVSTYFLEVHFHLHLYKKPHKVHLKDMFHKVKFKKIDFLILALLMLVAVSCCAIFDKMIMSSGANVFTNLFFSSGILSILIMFYLVKENIFTNTIKGFFTYPIRIISSILFSISAFFIVSAFALPGALLSLIIPVKRSSTLFASLFGGVLFHEKHLLKKMVATFVMVLGIFIIAFNYY